MKHMLISLVAAGVILGGPLTLYFIIKMVSHYFGGIKAKFVRPSFASDAESLGILVTWDHESYPHEINRVRAEYYELVPGGRSTSFSVTFEDKQARKKSFVLPLKLPKEKLEMLTDRGPQGGSRFLSRSYVSLEIETVKGETVRSKISKSALLDALNGAEAIDLTDVEMRPATEVDNWSVQTRVFPWRKVVADATAPDGHAKPKKSSGGGAPKLLDFIVTKVWIEPGCIVCDACENEAPDVFQVLADTCIVRPNAPLGNTASIVAAAEGCPVDVIKYDKAPKSA